MKPIDLAGFDAKFAKNADPWRTFDNRDEVLKRRAILHAMGPGPWGRLLELAAGNGSNSAAIAPRALRLDATEATTSGTALVAKAIRARPGRARAIRLAVPARLPRSRYDIAVVAELIYYLTPLAMARTARDVADTLGPGGILVLAHHRIDFPDFAQHAEHLQRRFLAATGRFWRVRVVRRTSHWAVLACIHRRSHLSIASSLPNQEGRRHGEATSIQASEHRGAAAVQGRVPRDTALRHAQGPADRARG